MRGWEREVRGEEGEEGERGGDWVMADFNPRRLYIGVFLYFELSTFIYSEN